MFVRYWGFIRSSTEARPALVRYRPSCQEKRGPDLFGFWERYFEIAAIGQRGDLLA